MSAHLEAFAAALDRIYSSLSTPGASPIRDAAASHEPGSGCPLAGTGVVIPFPHPGFSVKVPELDGAA